MRKLEMLTEDEAIIFLRALNDETHWPEISDETKTYLDDSGLVKNVQANGEGKYLVWETAEITTRGINHLVSESNKSENDKQIDILKELIAAPKIDRNKLADGYHTVLDSKVKRYRYEVGP